MTLFNPCVPCFGNLSLSYMLIVMLLYFYIYFILMGVLSIVCEIGKNDLRLSELVTISFFVWYIDFPSFILTI